MDEEMDEVAVGAFETVEVDLDYEYDAVRFFDFTRPESGYEARESESWFERASSYPPSPFVAKLFPTEDLYSEIVDYSLKPEYNYNGVKLAGCMDNAVEKAYPDQDTTYQGAEERSMGSNRNLAGGLLGGSSGSLFYNHMANDMKKAKGKFSVKPSFPRSSTLMKPTASHLAKQSQRCQVGGYRPQKNNSNSNAPVGSENQASKRQKLEGGLLRKIVDLKQPINLMRKVHSKDCAVPGMPSQSKLRITIPREPELETAHRAERIRSTTVKRTENPTLVTRRFRALPLNKKVLEKTCQNHAIETVNKDDKRCEAADARKKSTCQTVHSFKARPLDRKILTSRGDLGIFHNNKRDVTVPMEFQFQTSKRNQQNPPIELFSKLSLANEPQPKSYSHLESQRKSIFSKPLKENRWEENGHQNQHVKHLTKEKVVTCGKPAQNVANGFRISLRPF